MLKKSVAIVGDDNPALVGANVTFVCPPELVPTGPITATCMENGEWDSDPRNTECKGKTAMFNH